jgi:CheY-like chemotaxis protein
VERSESDDGGDQTGRILVVDDELPVASMLCELLVEDGHRAEAVSNGAAALKRLSESEYDLIISDMKMPGMGGEQLYGELRRRRPELCSRLLLTTGDTVGSEPRDFVARTGLDLVHKPFDVDSLRRTVRSRLANPGTGRRKA